MESRSRISTASGSMTACRRSPQNVNRIFCRSDFECPESSNRRPTTVFSEKNAVHPPAVAFFSPRRRPSPGSPARGLDASRPAPLRGVGCRSRAARRATLERLPGRHGPARILPSRSAGHGRQRRAVEQETPHTHSLNPAPRAHDRASKSSLACSIPSRLRWHSKISSFNTLTPASKSACLITSA